MKKDMTPTIRPSGSNTSDTIESHPAYAQISASRVTGHGRLYGSDFEHQHYVTITIRRSELHRGLSRDWPHAREELIDVALSEAQWASFVSTLNSGMGTQCTLNHVDCEPVPGIKPARDRKTQFTGEANAKLAGIVTDAKALAAEIEGRGRKSVMRDLISGIIAQFSHHSGLSFIAKQFDEHMEETVEAAKIEINSYIEARVHSAGLTALSTSPPIKMIDDKAKP